MQVCERGQRPAWLMYVKVISPPSLLPFYIPGIGLMCSYKLELSLLLFLVQG